MGTKQVLYKGMTINVGAFEVLATGRFIAFLSIARAGRDEPGAAQFFETPCADGLFDDACAALEAALNFGRSIIDGEVPGLKVAGE
jgi:hypothetical protein